MVNAYIALLRADGTEPEAASGYRRSCLGEVDSIEIPQLLENRQIPFPDVTEPGYGEIVAVAVSDREERGQALWVWPLPEPVDVHPGVTPVIYNGKLYRGVAVQAKVVTQSADLCAAGKTG